MRRLNHFDRWIIDIAASAPPRGHEDWARAMRAEFGALDGPRTAWALGCLWTAIGWRLKADGGYLLLFCLVAAFSVQLYGVFWLMALKASVSLDARAWFGPAFQYGRLLLPATSSLAFALFRPRYWILAGFVLPLAFVGLAAIETARAFKSSIWDVHPFNATLEVGAGALVGYCLVGAMAGRWLGSVRHGIRAANPRW